MKVDLEDYSCDLPVSMRSTYTSRFCDRTRDILEMLCKSNALATFFTLGYVVERQTELIEEIISQGHEVPSHIKFKNKTREDFKQDLVKSLEVLRRVSQEKIRGFRASFLSVNKNNMWDFEVLKKYVKYDSNVFPLRIHYCSSGVPNHSYKICDQDPFKIDDKGNIFEIPNIGFDTPTMGVCRCQVEPILGYCHFACENGY